MRLSVLHKPFRGLVVSAFSARKELIMGLNKKIALSDAAATAIVGKVQVDYKNLKKGNKNVKYKNRKKSNGRNK